MTAKEATAKAMVIRYALSKAFGSPDAYWLARSV
jgi:hypothetical protein